jgi:hypothetical protein
MGNVASYECLFAGESLDLNSPSALCKIGASAKHARWNTVKAYAPEELDKRRKALEELIESERSYVAGMEVIVDVFLGPLEVWQSELQMGQMDAKANKGELQAAPMTISPSEIQDIFLNVKQLAELNRQLLSELDSAPTPRDMLEVFLKTAPFFKMYSSYISGFEDAQRQLAHLEAKSSHFSCFVRACELQKSCHGLKLRDFLIMPIQRVPRYRLLLESILKYTKPSDPLHKRLQQNMEQVCSIASQLNSSIDLLERRQKVLELQYQFSEEFVTAARSFLKEGSLRKYCRNGPRSFQFVLFSDMLVYGSDSFRSKFGRQQYKMNRSIDLSHCFVVDGMPDGLFMIVSPAKSFLVQATDETCAAEWVAVIRKAMADLMYSADAESSRSAANSPRSLLTLPRRKRSDSLSTKQMEEFSLWVPVGVEQSKVIRQSFKLPRAASMQAPLKQILSSPQQRGVLRRHMEETFCQELIDFWEDAAKWSADAAKGNIQTSSARGIVDRYIRAGSSEEVNIGARTRDQCVSAAGGRRIPADLFKGPMNEVKDLLLRDVLPKFCASRHFSDLLAMLGGKQLPCGALDLDDLTPDGQKSGIIRGVSSPPSSPQARGMTPDQSNPGAGSVACPALPPPLWTPPAHRGARTATKLSSTSPPAKPTKSPAQHLDPNEKKFKATITVGSSGLGVNLGEDEQGRAAVRGYRTSPGLGTNPARDAGILVGDILLACNGVALTSFTFAIDKLRGLGEGSRLELILLRQT